MVLRGRAIGLRAAGLALALSGCSLGLGLDDYGFGAPDAGGGDSNARVDEDAGRPDGGGAAGSGGSGGAGGSRMDAAIDDAAVDAAIEAGADATIDAAVCPSDQRLTDAGTCVAAHPCEVDNGGCDQACVDSAGAAECRCDAGYRLEPDHENCRRVAFSDEPVQLLYPATDTTLAGFDVALLGHALVLTLESTTLRSRLYAPSNGWSASFATIPAGATGGARDVRVQLFDSSAEAVAVWHGYGGGPQSSYIYSSVWSNNGWTAPARRDVQNYDGAYSPDLTWDGRSRITASWVTWDQMIRPHIWIEGYELGEGWLGAMPVQPFVGTDPNSPASNAGRVIGIAPGNTLAVIDDSAAPVNLSWRIANSTDPPVAAVPGNPQPGSSFYVVGNRGHQSAFVVSRDAGSCRARRYTTEGFFARGFADGFIDSATVTTAACPVAINREGDGFALWVDAGGALQLARLPWDTIDSGDRGGEWQAPQQIVPSSAAGIGSPTLVVAQYTLDMAIVYLTTTVPAALYGTVFVEGDGWSAPRRLSHDNGQAVDATFRVGMDGEGNAIAVFAQPHNGSPGLWAAHLR